MNSNKNTILVYKKYKNFLNHDNRNEFEFFIILECLLKINSNELKKKYLLGELKLSKKTLFQLWIIYRGLKNNYPWEYKLNQCLANEHWYFIKKGVFIPREITYYILKDIENSQESYKNIIEFGIGCGYILCELGKLYSKANIYGVESYKPALLSAKINIKNNNLKNITLLNNDWTKNLNISKLNLIISNPPYVNNMHSINKYESKLATIGNKINNFDYYLELFNYSKQYLLKKGVIYIEITKKYLILLKKQKILKNYKITVIKKDVNVLIVKCIKIKYEKN